MKYFNVRYVRNAFNHKRITRNEYKHERNLATLEITFNFQDLTSLPMKSDLITWTPAMSFNTFLTVHKSLYFPLLGPP